MKTKCEVYSRVVGYLRPVNQWNDGKAAEFKDRKTFEVGEMKVEVAQEKTRETNLGEKRE